MNQAEILNNIIKNDCPAVFNLLSEKGRNIYFPKDGILAQSAEARGKKFNATIGVALEDGGSPMRLESISKLVALEPNDVFLYAPSSGKPELRKAWKELILKKNPSLSAPASLPVVTQALTHALCVLGHLFVNPGDTIIVPDKFWENYKIIFENFYGARMANFGLFSGSGFNTDGFKKSLNERNGKKIVLLNFPNNPTGYTPTLPEVEAIVNAIKERAEAGDEILVICDDAYFGLVYKEGVYKESVFARLADLHENVLAIKADAATKEDYVWGLRVGFLTYAAKGISPEVCSALEDKTAGVIRGAISNASNLSQSLVYAGISSPSYEAEKSEKFNILKERFDKTEEALKKDYSKHFRPLPFNSGYFMCVELVNGLPAEDVRKKLIAGYETGLIADGNLLRVAFSGVRADKIPQIFENIFNACEELCQK